MIKYVNSLNKTLTLDEWPYMFQSENIYSYEWKYETLGKKAVNFTRDLSEKDHELIIKADTEAEYLQAMNDFYETVEKDVLLNTPGKLYVGEYYIPCYITGGSNTLWSGRFQTAIKGVKVVQQGPWCKPVKFELRKTGSTLETTGMDFPFDFPFDFGVGAGIDVLEIDALGLCDFEMIIYGPVTDPEITINNQVYKVVTTIYTGEFLRIDSKKKEIIRYMTDGTPVNVFHSRADDNIFQKIPAGTGTVIYNVPLGIDITYYDERSEPLWISS